jgi:tRNA pseudouridine synthase 10
MKLKEKLIKLLEEDYVCNRCLGRQFAQLLSGYTNEQRGEILRTYLAMLIDSGEKINVDKSNLHGIKFHLKNIKPGKPKKCSVCGDLFPELKKKAKKIVKKLEKYEFDSFLIGSRPPDKLLRKEQRLWEKVGIEWCETIKSEINRVLGKEVEDITGKKMKRRLPDITVLYDLNTDEVKLNVRSIFIYGKYQKLVREMPQTTWKTRIYPVSVQDIIAKPFIKQTKAEDNTLHGCGREDVDVKCLGWRPFVLELVNPKRRGVDLEKDMETNIIQQTKNVVQEEEVALDG